MRRAKQILQIVGICTAVIGRMFLPFLPQTDPGLAVHTDPEGLTQSLFEWIKMTGAFVRPGLVLIFVGLGCLAIAALLPSGE